MANFAAFQPQGAPVNITVGTSSSGAQVTGDNAIQYRFVNNGANVIYWTYSSVAIPTAVVATGIASMPNTVEVFTLPPNVFIAAIASATGNTLQVTPGEGI